jgi:hypothetical protein
MSLSVAAVPPVRGLVCNLRTGAEFTVPSYLLVGVRRHHTSPRIIMPDQRFKHSHAGRGAELMPLTCGQGFIDRSACADHVVPHQTDELEDVLTPSRNGTEPSISRLIPDRCSIPIIIFNYRIYNRQKSRAKRVQQLCRSRHLHVLTAEHDVKEFHDGGLQGLEIYILQCDIGWNPTEARRDALALELDERKVGIPWGPRSEPVDTINVSARVDHVAVQWWLAVVLVPGPLPELLDQHSYGVTKDQATSQFDIDCHRVLAPHLEQLPRRHGTQPRLRHNPWPDPAAALSPTEAPRARADRRHA